MDRNHHSRRIGAPTLLSTGAAALVSGSALALSIGEPQFDSYLAQPLSLRIPLRDGDVRNSSREDLNTYFSVRLLPTSEYPRWNLEPPEHALTDFVLSLEPGQNDQFWVRIVSRHAIREPLLSLLLEIRSGDRSWIRQLDALLDPQPGAATAPATRPALAATASSAPASTVVLRRSADDLQAARPTAAARPDSRSTTTYGPVQAGETLSTIAQRVRPRRDIPLTQMIEALRRANPTAFYDGVHGLNAGASLRVPSIAEITAIETDEPWYATGPTAPGQNQTAAPIIPSAPVLKRVVQYVAGDFFALDLQFGSYLASRPATAAALAAIEAAEPPRFRADWTLSRKPAAPAPRPAAAPPAEVAPPAAEAAVPAPLADPVTAATVAAEPIEDASATAIDPATALAQLEQIAEQTRAAPDAGRTAPSAPAAEELGPPQPGQPTLTDADQTGSEPAVQAVATEVADNADSSGSRWWLWLLLFGAGFAAWRWQQRRASTERVEPPTAPPSAPSEPPEVTEAAAPPHPQQDSMALRIERFLVSPDAAEQRQAQVAQTLLQRNRPAQAEKILLELEQQELAPASQEREYTELIDWSDEPAKPEAAAAQPEIRTEAPAAAPAEPAVASLSAHRLRKRLSELQQAKLGDAIERELKVVDVLIRRDHLSRAQEILDRVAVESASQRKAAR